MKFLQSITAAVVFLVAALLPDSSQAQSVTTATLVITNAANTNYSIQINGQYRVWTNPVTGLNTQIQIDTNGTIGGTLTNLLAAYAVYPQPNTEIYIPAVLQTNIFTVGTNSYTNLLWVNSTNTICFQGYSGSPMAVILGSNWATLTTSVYTPTNFLAVRVPTNGMGLTELSNVANGLVGFLNSPFDIGAVNSALPQWSNFVNFGELAALSNQMLINGTNTTNDINSVSNILWTNTFYQVTNLGRYATNFTSNSIYYLTNISAGTVYLALAALSNDFGTLANNVSYHDLGNYTGDTNSIFMTNGGGLERVYGQALGGAIGGEFKIFTSGGVSYPPWLWNDTDDNTYIEDSAGHQRLQIQDPSADGWTALESSTGNLSLFIDPHNDTVEHFAKTTFNRAGYSSPSSVWTPAVHSGMVTNFPALQIPSDTTYNSLAFTGNDFTNAGDTFVRTVGFKFTASGTYSVTVEFQGNNVFQSGSMTISGAGYLSVRCEITAGTSGAYYWNSSATGSGLSTNTFASVGTGTLLTGSGNPTNTVVDIVSQASSNDTWIYVDNIELKPSAGYAYLP